MKFKSLMIKFVVFMMFFSSFTIISSAEESAEPVKGGLLDFDGIIGEWLEEEVDTPSGSSFRLWEHYGGFWADAEKDPDPGDNLLCWAATAANMMEWTGWGYTGGMEEDSSDEFFQFFRSHMTDGGHYVDAGIDWWFDGTLRDEGAGASTETTDHTGFWSGYTASDYMFTSWNKPACLPNIYNELTSGKPVGLSIYSDGGGAHAVTCWGVNYDTGVDPSTDPEDYYLGVWLTDSDSHKGQWDPDDVLRYFEVEYDSGDGRWEMPNYGGGWYIWGVTSLETFPGESRPVADAGGPYIVDEGSTVWFDASSSTDDDSLKYRWDFDDDGTWDTAWVTSSLVTHTWNDDYSGDVRLEVFDGRLRDVDVTTVTVNNVAPSITPFLTDIEENDLSTLHVSISDPGIEDTFEAYVEWGDGSAVEGPFNYGPGTTSFIKTHQYLDDNPTATPSDQYMVTVTVTDDDGGSDLETYDVTVDNVNPVATINDMDQPNPQFILPGQEIEFFGSYMDIGTQDTHTYYWDFDDTTIITGELEPTHIYAAPGDYNVGFTVTDDDTGTNTDTYSVHIADEFEALQDLDDYIQSLPDNVFKGNADNRKAALHNMILAINDMLVDMEYNGAINDLQNNIRGKSDGSIDGKTNNDWIKDDMAQYHICMKIDDITTYLATL